jgi:CheY-like chemotaxis protein
MSPEFREPELVRALDSFLAEGLTSSMALRVLLADESVTIKKVIQLALQDFAVEVKAVPVGLDVLEVSKSFQPDLVFADILLQKRSGYEVCGDLKKDPTTAAIPVVLMWSSFMELDQRQVDACGADGRLEKPFEVEALRKLVLELVPRTRSQRLAHFLEYPSSVGASMKNESSGLPTQQPAAPKVEPAPAPQTPPKPRMPPPLTTSPRAAPTSNPFGSSMDGQAKSQPGNPKKTAAPVERPNAKLDLTSEPPPTSSMDFTPTPGIPDRPATSASNTSSIMEPEFPRPPSSDELRGVNSGLNALPPLGALPDLQLEGSPSRDRAIAEGAKMESSKSWNMDSFEPLDLAPLSLDDDDADKDSFQPIQLPQAEPSPSPLSIGSTLGASLSLTNDDDDDAEADQWANKSLDKYRLPPLKPDESLAVDDMTPDFGHLEPRHPEPRADGPPPTAVTQIAPPPEVRRQPLPSTAHKDRFEMDATPSRDFQTDKTEIIEPGPKRKQAPRAEPDEDLPEFTLSDDDFDHTSRLEIEHVDQSEKTRPAIVRELLRDPDFTYGSETTVRRERDGTSTHAPKTGSFDRTMSGGGAIDLSSAGKPAVGPTDNDQLEAMVRDQVAPQLEKVIEKIVAQLLPQIAERIIKRELERLLEES